MKDKISIIIPTLNEVDYLSGTIENLLQAADTPERLQLIIVDAGSTDGTLESVAGYDVGTFHKPEFALHKYQSLNFGIAQASGDILIFLDADTMLPQHFDGLVRDQLSRPEVAGGAFEFAFHNPDWKLWSLQMINRFRYRFGKMFYGDQAVFCRKETAVRVGGYPEKQLMESAYFCKELKKTGKLKVIKSPVKTSPRRFVENGFFKVSWFDFTMWIRFTLNLPVEDYGKKYWGLNLESNG